MKRISALFFAGVVACAQDGNTLEQNIRAALANRIDTGKNGVGIVVGLLTPDGRSYIGHGVTDSTGGGRPDRHTMFEIGSITKVFTSLLLADMVERAQLKLDDPVSAYLPRTVAVPRRNGKEITLADLATHTSGLPRDAGNMDMRRLNPFADYGPDQLYSFLAAYKLERDPGVRYEYSNIGAILLAHVLTLRAGVSYEELLRKRILEPLGMTDTTITLSDEQRRRMATGYDSTLEPVPLWDADTIPGAGSIRSTAADMLTFAAACLGMTDTPLQPAMRRMITVARPSGSPSMTLHLGWGEFQIGGGVLFSNGRRGGYTSAFALRPSLQRAAIVLSNSTQSVDDIAIHGVYPERSLRKFDPPPASAPVGENMLESYTGVYEFAPKATIEISRQGGRLFGQVAGQGRFEMFADNDKEDEFVARVVNVRFKFFRGGTGAITALVLFQNGIEQRAQRMKK